MNAFALINPEKENELLQYINDKTKEIWKLKMKTTTTMVINNKLI